MIAVYPMNNSDNTMNKIITVFLAATVLSGCHIYKAYERPESVNPTDSIFRNNTFCDSVSVVSSDSSSISDLSWKELFTDTCLQKLIDSGLKNNTDLNIARLKVKEAEAFLLSSRLSYLPSLMLTPQGTVNKVGSNKATRTYDIAVAAEWEIDLFGKTLNNKRGAEAALAETDAYRQAVQTQLVATIANSYYTLLLLDKQLEISSETSLIWNENLRVMRALKKAGQATEMAVAQTEAGKLEIDASVVSLQRQINETENELSVLLAVSPQSIQRSSLDVQTFPENVSVGVPLHLLAKRPDIRQSEAQLAVAYYATNVARSAFYPGITLSGSAGWTNAAGSAISNPGQWLLNAIGSLVQPLFNRGQNIANLKIAKAQQEEALLNFRQSLLDAGAEVNDALVQWQSARSRIKLNEQQVVSLKSALKSAELLMKHSSQNYLEVLTARQSLLEAELNVASDRFDEIQGVINLYHSLGGGY